jgi:hypothetical protein
VPRRLECEARTLAAVVLREVADERAVASKSTEEGQNRPSNLLKFDFFFEGIVLTCAVSDRAHRNARRIRLERDAGDIAPQRHTRASPLLFFHSCPHPPLFIDVLLLLNVTYVLFT